MKIEGGRTVGHSSRSSGVRSSAELTGPPCVDLPLFWSRDAMPSARLRIESTHTGATRVLVRERGRTIAELESGSSAVFAARPLEPQPLGVPDDALAVVWERRPG